MPSVVINTKPNKPLYIMASHQVVDFNFLIFTYNLGIVLWYIFWLWLCKLNKIGYWLWGWGRFNHWSILINLLSFWCVCYTNWNCTSRDVNKINILFNWIVINHFVIIALIRVKLIPVVAIYCAGSIGAIIGVPLPVALRMSFQSYALC